MAEVIYFYDPKKDLYPARYEQYHMNISRWIQDKLEVYCDLIVIIGIISSIFTILGITMHSILAPLWDMSISFSEIAAILNTIITFFVIRWGLHQKNERKTIESKIAFYKNETIKYQDECKKLFGLNLELSRQLGEHIKIGGHYVMGGNLASSTPEDEIKVKIHDHIRQKIE